MILRKMKVLNVFLACVMFVSGFAAVSLAQDIDFQDQDRKIKPKDTPPKVVPGEKKDEKKDDKGNQNPPPSSDNGNRGKGKGKP